MTSLADANKAVEEAANNAGAKPGATKMSETDRTALIEQLKADSEARKLQMLDLVRSVVSKQAKSAAISSNDEDALWR